MAKFKYFQKQKEYFKNDFLVDDDKKSKDGLSFFGLLKTIVRNIIVFLSVSISLSGLFVFLGVKNAKTQYYSYGEISFKEYVYGDLYTTVQEDMSTDAFCKAVKDTLDSKGYKHSDDSEITLREIKSGISSSHLSDSNNIFVKYYNSDESIVVFTVNEIILTAVDYYKDGHDNKRINQFIEVGSLASLSYKDTPQLPFYLGFGVVGSLLLAFSICLIIDKARKLILCPYDVKANNLLIISLTKKKNKMEETSQKLQNELGKIFAVDVQKVRIIPTGKSDPIFLKSIFSKNINNSKNIVVEEPITKDNSLCLISHTNNEINILLFESGKCSTKDLNSISLNQIDDYSESVVGVFVE